MRQLLEVIEPHTTNEDQQLVRSIWTHAERYCYPPIIVVNQNTKQNMEIMLPYHNFPHAADTALAAANYCSSLRERGASIDTTGVVIAALLHDMDFTANLEIETERLKRAGVIKKQAPTLHNKETLAAIKSRVLLASFGVDRRRINRVENGIRATAVGRAPRTLFEKVLVRADLDGLTKEPAVFFAGTIALLQEASLLSRKPITDPVVGIGVLHDVLKKYISRDLSFGRYEDNYEDTFQRLALGNIALLGKGVAAHTLRRFSRG